MSDSVDFVSGTKQGTDRRTLLKGAAWSVPVMATAIAAPLAAATVVPPRVFTLKSNFGAGWYPWIQGITLKGWYQFDTDDANKYFYLEGTQAGDIITNVTVKHRVSTNWPAMNLYPVAGSNSSWTTPVFSGIETVGGVSFRTYTMTFTGSVVATEDTTHIPIGFYFRTGELPFYSGGKMQTSRSLLVNGQLVTVTGPTNNVVNTNNSTPPQP